MKIEIENQGYFEITVIERGTAGIDYDWALELSVSSGDFSGSSSFWVDGTELKCFLNNLKSMCNTLRGEAHISSVSPGEMNLVIKPMDSLGRFTMKVMSGRRGFLGSEEVITNVNVAFTLESEALSSVCKKLVEYFEGELSAE